MLSYEVHSRPIDSVPLRHVPIISENDLFMHLACAIGHWTGVALPELLSDTLMLVTVTNSSLYLSRRMALVSMLVAVLVQAAFCESQHPGLPRGQKHDARHEIDQLEEAWRNAVLTSNVAVMNTLLAEDYMPSPPWNAANQGTGLARLAAAGALHLLRAL